MLPIMMNVIVSLFGMMMVALLHMCQLLMDVHGYVDTQIDSIIIMHSSFSDRRRVWCGVQKG